MAAIKNLSETEFNSFAEQVAKGMKHLHKNKVCGYDSTDLNTEHCP